VDFDIGVVCIGLAGQQRFEPAPVDVALERFQRLLGFRDDALILLGLAEFDQADIVREFLVSCMRREAFCGSSQSLESSASRFSSARRRSDFSTSKRPPQQSERLLDLFDDLFDFGAHCFDSPRCQPSIRRGSAGSKRAPLTTIRRDRG
jgi:hypothetical protein